MIKILELNKAYPFIELVLKNKTKVLGHKYYGTYYGSIFSNAKLDLSNNLNVYIDNLKRLGLIEIPEDKYLTAPNTYEPMWSSKELDSFRILKPVDLSPDYVKKVLKLTALGKSFKQACLS